MARYGVTIFPTDYSIQPVELARAVEERGFDSLFITEHTHIPTSRRTPWPGGGDLPKDYWHTHDPFVALGAMAAVTERIKLGTGVCLVVERDPIQLAKEVASLDMISGGRVILGVGAGWNAEEMENHGVTYATRWKLVREKVLAMKTIWTEDEPEYHGDFVDFDKLWSWPKPVQPGGPPIWLGAQSKWAYDRVVDYCDGWMPINLMGGLDEGHEELRKASERGGRDYESIDSANFAAAPNEDVCRANVDKGFTDQMFALPSESAEKVLPKLDKLAELVIKVR
jgi:probable F420-dependent oxidoreductase